MYVFVDADAEPLFSLRVISVFASGWAPCHPARCAAAMHMCCSTNLWPLRACDYAWNRQALDKINPFAAVELNHGQGLHVCWTMGLYPRPFNQGQTHTGSELWSWPMKWNEAWDESLIQAQIELHSKGSSIHHSPLKEDAAPGMDLTNWNGQRQRNMNYYLSWMSRTVCVSVYLCVRVSLQTDTVGLYALCNWSRPALQTVTTTQTIPIPYLIY